MRIFVQNNFIEFVNEFPTMQQGEIYQSIRVEDAYSFYLSLKQTNAFARAYIKTDDIESAFATFARHFKIREAAGGLVCKDNKQLWIFRNGKWDLPKGHIEDDETTEEAAVREVQEECGIEAEITKQLPITYHIYPYHGSEIIKKTHWFEMTSKDTQIPQPQTEEGIERVVWLKESEIPYMLNNTWASIEYLVSSLMTF